MEGCSATRHSNLYLSMTSHAVDLQRIVSDQYSTARPQLSQNGEMLIYSRFVPRGKDNTSFQIMIKNMKKGEPEVVIQDRALHPSWSSDGISFLYVSLKSRHNEFYRCFPDSNLRAYKIDFVSGFNDAFPVMRNKFNEVVFNSTINKKNFINILHISNHEKSVLIEGEEPRWHPEKNIIIYQNHIKKRKHTINTFDRSTNRMAQLSKGEENYLSPSYSPDGNYVVFVKAKFGKRTKVFIMNANGDDEQQLTAGNSVDVNPFWGTDGYIYFNSNSGSIIGVDGKPKYDIWRIKPKLTKK